MRIRKAQKHTYIHSYIHTFKSFVKDKKSQRSYKTVEIEAFITIFAWWWKDPEPDPYLWITDPGGPKTYGSGSPTLHGALDTHDAFFVGVVDTPGMVFVILFLYSLIPLHKIFRKSSVADPGCLSRIPDPDFYQSRIPDPKTSAKGRGEKFFFVKPFFVATNFTKL